MEVSIRSTVTLTSPSTDPNRVRVTGKSPYSATVVTIDAWKIVWNIDKDFVIAEGLKVRQDGTTGLSYVTGVRVPLSSLDEATRELLIQNKPGLVPYAAG